MKSINQLRKKEIRRSILNLKKNHEEFYHHLRNDAISIDPVSSMAIPTLSRLSEDKASLETSIGTSFPIADVFDLYTKLKKGNDIMEYTFSSDEGNSIYKATMDNGIISVILSDGEAPWTLLEEDIREALRIHGYKF